jgi:hypothetical protein
LVDFLGYIEPRLFQGHTKLLGRGFIHVLLQHHPAAFQNLFRLLFTKREHFHEVLFSSPKVETFKDFSTVDNVVIGAGH